MSRLREPHTASELTYRSVLCGLPLAVLAYSLGLSRFGHRCMTAIGVDWAHHLTLIESLLLDGTRKDLHGNLAEMSVYAPASHEFAAWVSRLLSIPPPQTIQIVCAFAIAGGCFFLALLWLRAWKGSQARGNPPARAVQVAISLFIFLLAAKTGFGLRDQIKMNFFYSQAVGTALAIAFFWALNALSERVRPVYLEILSYAALLILLAVHGVPAIWFACAAILFLAPDPAGWKPTLRRALVMSVVMGAEIVTNPFFRAMSAISLNNADFVVSWVIPHWRLRSLSDSAMEVSLVLGALVTLILVIPLGILFLKAEKKEIVPYLRRHAGLLAALAVLFLQGFALKAGFGSPYAIKKDLPFVAMFLPVSLVAFRAWPKTPPENRLEPGSPLRSGLAAALFALAFLTQLPFLSSTVDQTELIQRREELLKDRGTAASHLPRRYPEFFPSGFFNYYLAIGVLAYPRDPQTVHWFLHGFQGEPPWPSDPSSR